MKIQLEISHVRSTIPIPRKQSTTYPRLNLNESPYILIGFNEAITKTKKRRIALEKLEGIYDFEGEISPKQEAMSGMLCELVLPIDKSETVWCYQIHGKKVVFWLDEIKTKIWSVNLYCRTDPRLIYCSFVCTLRKHTGIPKDIIGNERLKLKREKIYSRLNRITQQYDQDAHKLESLFPNVEKNLETYKTSVAETFTGPRIVNSFLFVRIHETDEEFWKSLFNQVMIHIQTAMGIDREDELATFNRLDVWDKIGVMVLMFTYTTNMSQYILDYILGADGLLTRSHAAYYSSNFNEGCGDCKDGTSFVRYFTKTFISYPKEFVHAGLQWMQKVMRKYLIEFTFVTMVNKTMKLKS